MQPHSCCPEGATFSERSLRKSLETGDKYSSFFDFSISRRTVRASFSGRRSAQRQMWVSSRSRNQRLTFHLSKAPMGPTMSSETSADSLIEPSQDALGSEAGGRISATGRPKRVTRIGLPVRRTPSSTARQVALNLDIAISCTLCLYHGQRP